MISKVSKQKIWILNILKDTDRPRCAHDITWNFFNKDGETGGRDGGIVPSRSCYSSVYRSLNQLEKDGLVQRHDIRMGYINEVGRHIREGYALTDLGIKYLSINIPPLGS